MTAYLEKKERMEWEIKHEVVNERSVEICWKSSGVDAKELQLIFTPKAHTFLIHLMQCFQQSIQDV